MFPELLHLQSYIVGADFKVAVSMPGLDANGNFVQGSDGLGRPKPMRGWSVNQEHAIGNDLVVGEELNGSPIEAITISVDDLINRHDLSLPKDIDHVDGRVDAHDPSFVAEDFIQKARANFGL